MKKNFQSFGADFSASIVVLLVALPLCLGIALASGAPAFSGIIAGIIGGVVVGVFSGSSLSVSGPAAGLTVIVAGAILKLQSYDVFLLSVVIAGCFQLILGFLKAGFIGDYIPNSVIKGMLAAIGLILILKQLQHLVGYDKDFEGDFSFIQKDTNENTFSALLHAFKLITPVAIFIGFISMIILVVWELPIIKKQAYLKFVPGPLVVVVLGVCINQLFLTLQPSIALQNKHLVNLPIATTPQQFLSFFTLPDFQKFTNPNVWITAFTLAIVASLETLLGIEAVDKLDSLKRISPTNTELKAQGIGNIVSGLIGGLPLTSVIVRSSANVASGAKSKMSTILHGLLLLICVMFIPTLLNKIPLSSLAAILIFTGYKLAKVKLFKEFFAKGWDQFIPFVVTIIAILLTDLLIGIVIGILVGLFFMIRSNFISAVLVVNNGRNYMVRLRKDVSFLNKPILKKTLYDIPENAFLIIDVSHADFIDKDIIEEINNYLLNAQSKNIQIEIKRNHHKTSHNLFNQQVNIAST
ncbi:MAG: SulP family inorganic anion transporter [Chitinophagaceae bacterium]